MKHKKEYYTCKRYRLLSYLMQRGFTPSKTLPDPDNPRYKVWRFRNSAKLEAAVEEYFTKLKGGAGK